jgi:hypothetical protein
LMVHLPRNALLTEKLTYYLGNGRAVGEEPRCNFWDVALDRPQSHLFSL